MSSFTRFDGDLHIEYALEESDILGRDFYRVLEPFRYYIGEKGSAHWISIDEGYLTDGASVPRLFWSLVPPMGRYAAAAVIHDKLCETLRVYSEEREAMLSIPRKTADSIFLEAMKVLNVPTFKRNLMYTAVATYRVAAKVDGPEFNREKFLLEQKWLRQRYSPHTD